MIHLCWYIWWLSDADCASDDGLSDDGLSDDGLFGDGLSVVGASNVGSSDNDCWCHNGAPEAGRSDDSEIAVVSVYSVISAVNFYYLQM